VTASDPISAASKSASLSSSLTSTAVAGGAWIAVQVAVNKAVALLGTLAVMYLLTPHDYGLASLALSVMAGFALLPPFTLSDVLIATPNDVELRMRMAIRICAVYTALTVLAIAAVSPLIARYFMEPDLMVACWWVALRPVVDLLVLAPQTRLRLRLDFRRIAVIDAITQIGATVSSIGMAALGYGYLSLILPQIAATAGRAFLYSRAAGPSPRSSGRDHRSTSEMVHQYIASGMGQYIHAGMLTIVPFIIAHYSDEIQTGLYAMAFSLSAATNGIVAVSLGMVLQPVFARMAGDTERQAGAFVRACSAIAVLAMPLLALQCLLSRAAFAELLPPRWEGAVVMAQLLCAGYAFYFPVNPAMGLLKAQGKFWSFFFWQFGHFLVVTSLMLLVGEYAGESASVYIVAVLSFSQVVFSPVGIILCTPRGEWIKSCVSVYAAPMGGALVSVLPPFFAIAVLVPEGKVCNWLQMIIVPLVALPIYWAWIRLFAKVPAAELSSAFRAIKERLVVPVKAISPSHADAGR